MNSINATTDLYCIFGNPVTHSLSPELHNAAFRHAGINAVYLAFQPDSIQNAIRSMKALSIKGASITIPYKNEALRYVDEFDPLAKDIGAINTLLNDEGRIKGYNTDGLGAALALKKAGAVIKNATVLVIGNGGSARAIAFSIIHEGGKVLIAGRNRERISGLANDLKKGDPTTDFTLIRDLRIGMMENISIIINTTPLGMSPHTDAMPIDEELLLPSHTVFDIVYAPHVTKLLRCAVEKGCGIIHGREMLLYQGTRQFEIWTGHDAPIDIMRNVLDERI